MQTATTTTKPTTDAYTRSAAARYSKTMLNNLAAQNKIAEMLVTSGVLQPIAAIAELDSAAAGGLLAEAITAAKAIILGRLIIKNPMVLREAPKHKSLDSHHNEAIAAIGKLRSIAAVDQLRIADHEIG